jgi:uncharacterized protein YjbJ (UPF0337 family)
MPLRVTGGKIRQEAFEGKGIIMNWDRVEGQWKQRRGKAVHHWGRLMNDELAAIAGKYEELVGRLQEQYGVAKEEGKRKVNEFNKMVNQLKKSNIKLVDAQRELSRQKKAIGSSPKSRTAANKKVEPKIRRIIKSGRG